MKFGRALLSLCSLSPALALACGSTGSDGGVRADDPYSSNEATELDFSLDGELTTNTTTGLIAKIQDQFLYTIGNLNGDASVGRLDKLVLTNIAKTMQADGSIHVTYHAALPVSWGKHGATPTSYVFTLPSVVTTAGLQSFTTKYRATCTESGGESADPGSMWYYYRPNDGGCALAPVDVVTLTATVTPSANVTTGKYPEYHKVWEDNELRVISIFGKYEAGSTSDVGIDAYDDFVAAMVSALQPYSLTTVPAALPARPGAAITDVELHGTLPDGKKITVNAMLTDLITAAPPEFFSRYDALSSNADLIMYNGHAGLGQNVRELASHGTFLPGKYLLLFMNGCDTFAYVDGSLAQKRAALNPDDNADGTKYMDIMTNSLPSYFSSNAQAAGTLVRGLIDFGNPKTFQQLFSTIDGAQEVLVTGEEDNVFVPGTQIGTPPPGAWQGQNDTATIAAGEEKRYATPTLPAGTYTFTITGSDDGDADLFVKAGAPPTTTSFDCRPYLEGSNETCSITLTAPAVISAMVRGYAPSSTFDFTAR